MTWKVLISRACKLPNNCLYAIEEVTCCQRRVAKQQMYEENWKIEYIYYTLLCKVLNVVATL